MTHPTARLRPWTSSARTVLLASALFAFLAAPLQAQDADFQTFFFAICGSATGALGVRCGESQGGDLSGASESSLNPSQTLSSNDTVLDGARNREKQVREGAERSLAEAEAPAATASVAIGPWSVLANLRGSWVETQRDSLDQERGYEAETMAGELGFDYRLSARSVIGALLAAERSDADFDAETTTATFTAPPDAGSIDADSTALTLYATFMPTDRAFVDASLGFSGTDYQFSRNSVFQDSAENVSRNVRTRGDTSGDQYWLSVNGGIEFARGSWTYGPNLGVSFNRSSVDAYTEADLSGTGLNMRVGKSERDSLPAHLGFRAGAALSTAGAVVLPQFRIELEHEFEDEGESVSTSFALDAANTALRLAGDDRDSDAVNVGLGIAAILPNGWVPFLDAELLVGDDNRDRVRAVLGVRKEL